MSKTASEQIVEMFSKDFKSSLERQRQAAEHQRLKDAVVEAAKADMLSEIRQEGDNGIDRMIAARRAYRAAVHVLLEFESSSTKEK